MTGVILWILFMKNFWIIWFKFLTWNKFSLVFILIVLMYTIQAICEKTDSLVLQFFQKLYIFLFDNISYEIIKIQFHTS